jgi:pimeloyl-ACP methyl ester carboxylesterase
VTGETTAVARGRASDLRGWSRLAIEATVGVTGLVEAEHRGISPAPTSNIARFVYRCVRGVTRAVGGGIDAALGRLGPLLGEDSPSRGREALVAALNGVVGDHLAATGNPLATSMRLRPGDGAPVSGKLVVLAHGLCMNDLQWDRQGHDHGAALARDLGYTPVYLRYNSGLHVSTNGRAFAAQLEALVNEWPVPVEELAVVAHSMGGLVTRSACHYGKIAGHGWLRTLKKIVFLGTPHQGAALERGGNWVDVTLGISRYTAPFARLGKIRSAGITDLRHGSLLDEDWQGRDRFAHAGDRRRPVPLPEGVECSVIAATAGEKTGGLAGKVAADGLVPVDSALGRHADPERSLPIPESRRWVIHGIHHFDLLSEPAAYEKIKEWLV